MLRAMGGPGLKNLGQCHLYNAVLRNISLCAVGEGQNIGGRGQLPGVGDLLFQHLSTYED